MDNRKITWPLILVAILTIALCSGFIFDWGKKKAKDPSQAAGATAAAQEKRVALAEEKLVELNRKIDEQAGQLAVQEEKLAELKEITKRLDGIEASLKNRDVDINDSDMTAIREMIEQQVKLNVKKAEMPAMGVVSLRKIFRDCKKAAQYRQETNVERRKNDIEKTNLQNEIQAQKEGLKTLKIGSDNYMTEVKEILEKQAILQARQEFNNQQLALKEKKLTENLYRDILRITRDIASEKGLELVFEASEPDLPASNPTELELSMGTHKLLFGGGCQDITDEVIKRLDADLLEK
jgi:Skp family chaperone for outer membrane proteins